MKSYAAVTLRMKNIRTTISELRPWEPTSGRSSKKFLRPIKLKKCNGQTGQFYQYQISSTKPQVIQNMNLFHHLIKSLSRIRATAVRVAEMNIPELEYTADKYCKDLDIHLESFLNAIPPFETPGDLRNRCPTDLATI